LSDSSSAPELLLLALTITLTLTLTLTLCLSLTLALTLTLAVNSGELTDKCWGTVSTVCKFYAVKHTNTNNNKANHTCTAASLPIAQGLTGILPLHSHHLGIGLQLPVTNPISLTINLSTFLTQSLALSNLCNATTTTTTIFIWEKATRLPERAQAHQSWPPKSQVKKMQYMHRKTYRTEIC